MRKNGILALLLLVVFQVVPAGYAQQAVPQSQGPFVDVNDPNVYDYTAIQYLKTNNVVQGYPGGYFYPQNPISRAEFVKIIAAAQGLPLKETKCGFNDVDEKHWAASYICAAKKAGWVSGYSDGSFKLNDTINASEAAKIIAGAYKLSVKTDATVWYKGYFEALSTRKVIPLSVEYFDQKLTRSDMALMTYRLKANISDEASRTYDEINGTGFVKATTCQELQDRIFYRNDKEYSLNSRGIAKDAQSVGSPMPTESGGGSGGGYSTTNIQVPGVDEADFVKTDGDKIYMLKNDTVRVIQATPVDGLKELVRMKLGNENETFYPTEMYLNGKQLVLIGSAYTYAYNDNANVSSSSYIYPPFDRNNRTRVYLIDVTDPKNPSISRTVEFEAYSTSSRRIGNSLYLVMSQYVSHPYPPYPIPYYEKTAPGGIIAPYPYPYPVPQQSYNPDEIMPRMKDSKDQQEKNIASCSDVLVLPKPESANFLIVAGIPLDDSNKEVSRQILVGNSDNVYVSNQNLFVAATDWTGGFVPADSERVPYYYYPTPEKTAIYKFGLSNGEVKFTARGNVPGRVLNQFSMDEYDNNFRLATTSTEYYPVTKTLNHVYVLDKNMTVSGKIEDLAPGETIYSARFTGDRGYVVTFRQVDPLFVLDLSDPKKPSVGGSLKIPGYSSYIHPYDENHIIGFGNEVDETTGTFKGLKMSLFDVTNITSPKEMYTERIGAGGTTSDVLYNHKALLFDREKNLLSLPVTVYDSALGNACSEFKYSSCPATCQKICVPTNCTTSNGIQVCTTDCDGENSCIAPYGSEKAIFQGAYVYNIDPAKGFALRGKVTHFTPEDIKAGGEYWYPDYNKAVQRILYIGDTLYTISLGMIKANGLGDLSEKKAITISE